MNYCCDCKWVLMPGGGWNYARCTSPAAQKPNTGESLVHPSLTCAVEYKFAATMRRDQTCGPEAKLFETKETS